MDFRTEFADWLETIIIGVREDEEDDEGLPSTKFKTLYITEGMIQANTTRKNEVGEENSVVVRHTLMAAKKGIIPDEENDEEEDGNNSSG